MHMQILQPFRYHVEINSVEKFFRILQKVTCIRPGCPVFGRRPVVHIVSGDLFYGLAVECTINDGLLIIMHCVFVPVTACLICPCLKIVLIEIILCIGNIHLVWVTRRCKTVVMEQSIQIFRFCSVQPVHHIVSGILFSRDQDHFIYFMDISFSFGIKGIIVLRP